MRNPLRRERKMPQAHPKQPDTLHDAVERAIRKGEKAWEMAICHREGRLRTLAEVFRCSIIEAADLVPGLTDWLRGNYGAGQFVIKLYDGSNHEKAQYSYPVGGATPYRSGVTSGEGAPAGGWGSSNASIMKMFADQAQSDRQFAQQLVMETIKARGDGNSTIETLKAAADIMAPRGGGFEQQLMSTLIDNHFVKENNMFSNIRDAMEIFKTMQPVIPAEDPTVQMLTSMVPMVTAMIAARSGQPVASVMPNLIQRIQAIPDAQLQSLKSAPNDQIRAYLTQLAGAPAGVALPAPGQTAGAPSAPAPTTAGGPVTETAAASQAPAQDIARPPAPDPHLEVVETMIERLRQDIRDGEDPGVQASTLIAIVEYNRGLLSPHRLVVGLMNATGENYETEFERFCAAVPELASNENARNALGMALSILLMDRHGIEAEPEAEPELETEETAEVEPEEPVPFLSTEEAVTDAPRPDVPGSTGVRGRDEHGRDAERDASGSEQPSAEDGGEAVREDESATPLADRKVA